MRWRWLCGWAVLACGCSVPVDVLSTAPTTWHGDVAPLFARACWSCHLADDPVPLVTFEHGRALASPSLAIAASTTAHPVSHDDTGRCRDVATPSAPLSAEELETLARWIASGTPEGDPAEGPAPPASALDGRGETRMAYPVDTLPDPEVSLSHCFVLPPADLDRDVFVVGFEVRGGARVVRQVALLANDAEGQHLAELSDGADDAPGYPCSPDTREPGAPPITDPLAPITRFVVAAAAPGLPDDVFPPTRGVRARAGLGFVARVDFFEGLTEAPHVILQMAVARQVERELAVVPLLDEAVVFPGGRSHVVSMTPGLQPTVELVGVAAVGGPRLVGAGLETEHDCVLEMTGLRGSLGRTVTFETALPQGDLLRGWCVHDMRGVGDLSFGSSPAGESCILGLYVDLGPPR